MTLPRPDRRSCGCGRANRPDRRYCGDCGAALGSPCPRCRFDNDRGDRHCGGCGSAIDAIGAIELDASTTQAVPAVTMAPALPTAARALTETLVRLNRSVPPPDLEDMTSDIEAESDDLAQDQIDALFEN